MKNFIFLIFCLFPLVLSAQSEAQVQTHLAAAETANSGGDLEEARFQLQQALVELDKVVGQKILEVLPLSIKDLKADTDSDQYAGVYTGFTGLFVERTYVSASDPNKKLQFSIISDSPTLAGLTKMMNNSFMASMAGMDIIRLDGYKATLEEVENSDPLTININLPFNDTLMALECKGCESKAEATEMAEQIPVKEITEIAK